MGDHLFPQVYKADYKMWLPLISNDNKNIAEPYEGGGGGRDQVNFIVTHPKSSNPPSFPPP